MTTPDGWKAGATFNPESWWPRWGEWLAKRSGRKVPARRPQESLATAPGTYVVATPVDA
jgi:polyhydroxyalkanoate synthase